MSLKWYPNARIDETQEAYGKTWRVDKIENDGAIVFRCGKDTAMAPRTDSPDQVAWKPLVGKVNDILASVERHPIKDDRQRQNRQRQAENADKTQKAMAEFLERQDAKLLIHDEYTFNVKDVDMQHVEDRLKSFIGGMATKPELSEATLVDYVVFKGWAEKGWNGI
jgi:Lhr-like helicase